MPGTIYTRFNDTFVQYLLIRPTSLTIPPCQTEADLVLSASMYKNVLDSSRGIGTCPFFPIEFSIFKMTRLFGINTST